jgi:hypothetical protein
MTSTPTARPCFDSFEGMMRNATGNLAARWSTNTSRGLLVVAAELIAVALLLGSSTFAHGDTIVIKNSNGNKEEYSGSVTDADQDRIVFDVECSGKVREIRWGNTLAELRLNDICRPARMLGAGGFDLECSKPFQVIDNFYEQDMYQTKFTYSHGVLTFNDGGSYDIKNSAITDVKGTRTKVPARKERLTVTITHMRTEGWCSSSGTKR